MSTQDVVVPVPVAVPRPDFNPLWYVAAQPFGTIIKAASRLGAGRPLPTYPSLRLGPFMVSSGSLCHYLMGRCVTFFRQEVCWARPSQSWGKDKMGSCAFSLILELNLMNPNLMSPC